MIEMLNERDELCALVRDTFLASFYFFVPIIWGLNRSVWSVVSEIHEEWLFAQLAIIEIINSPCGKQICRMSGWVNFLFVFAEVINAVPTVFVIIVNHVAQEALEIIEPAFVGRVRCFKPKMPFANNRCMVANRLQRIWQ